MNAPKDVSRLIEAAKARRGRSATASAATTGRLDELIRAAAGRSRSGRHDAVDLESTLKKARAQIGR